MPVPLSALALASRLRPEAAAGGAAIARLKVDLVADNAPAQRDFGYAPRNFVAEDVLPAPESVYK